uniref:Uncharacterized protein n=1 Tax=Ananas comosus var. bracteatus TaxID=296719 RepID=A0A6V7NP33_ANACO|nr:unnamed protein product [Ananas comosus var. bracteatus]
MSRRMAEPSEQAERAESATGGGWRGALRRGWRVGKAAAIAGAAIVVVPPLLVLSALGAALSLPFGAYLASLACTDRLMRSLLPPPQYQEDYQWNWRLSPCVGGIGVAPQDENIGAARKVFEEMIVSSKEGGVREERVIAVADNVVAGTVEPSGGVVVESVEIVGESEPPGFSSGYASAVEDQSVDTADVESRSSVEHAGAFIAADIMVAVETETAASFDVEDFYDEEKLWEQLSAMRTIVGYKAAPSSSLAEEMRAIYLFTGVEPPPISSGDVSDLREVNRKLHFLKSVIGVK